MMESKYLTSSPILDEKGQISEEGFSFDAIKEFKKDRVSANSSYMEEWEEYILSSKEGAIDIKAKRVSKYLFLSLCILDFKSQKANKGNLCLTLPKKSPFSESSEEGMEIKDEDKGIWLAIGKTNKQEKRVRLIDDSLKLHLDLYFVLKDSFLLSSLDAYEEKTLFGYEQNQLGVKGRGYLKIEEKAIDFNDSIGNILFGRGAYPKRRSLFSSFSSFALDDQKGAWSLSQNVQDKRKPYQNAIFFGDLALKEEDAIFDVPISERGMDDYMGEWKIRNKEGSFSLCFHPLAMIEDGFSSFSFSYKEKRMFGRFDGFISMQGKEITISNAFGITSKINRRK